MPTIAPPEGIEPSLPEVRSWGPASTGGGYRRFERHTEANLPRSTKSLQKVAIA